jgi:hypothetical protein
MTTSWMLAMGRDDFARTALVYAPMPDPSDGEVRLRVDRFGLSANNVTYAVLGKPVLAVLPARAAPSVAGRALPRPAMLAALKQLYHSTQRVMLCETAIHGMGAVECVNPFGCATPDERFITFCLLSGANITGPITAHSVGAPQLGIVNSGSWIIPYLSTWCRGPVHRSRCA